MIVLFSSPLAHLKVIRLFEGGAIFVLFCFSSPFSSSLLYFHRRWFLGCRFLDCCRRGKGVDMCFFVVVEEEDSGQRMALLAIWLLSLPEIFFLALRALAQYLTLSVFRFSLR